MVSSIPPVGITQNERFLSCDTVLIGVRFVVYEKSPDSIGLVGVGWTRPRDGMSMVRISEVGRDLSLPQNVRTSQVGTHSASYSIGTRFLPSG
jgi:hypothetical protein